MIGYVRGRVSHLFADYCFIDVQGVGYRVFIANSTLKKLTVGKEASLFTYLHVREDALLLYGFASEDEYQLFLQLTSVTGIGPKGALGILSSITPNEFRLAIGSRNLAMLTKIPGIGKKTAERLVLELKDKVGSGEAETAPDDEGEWDGKDDPLSQAAQALISLGYSQAEIGPELQKLGKKGYSVEQLIKLTLKEFGRR
ncbi:MAG: Holliday junction branch migration protein RuvA [Veillonellales bacterium]